VKPVDLGGGRLTDARTANMLAEAQRIAGFDFLYAQGSYNGTAVSASAGTHAGGGVVDIRTIPMGSRARKITALKALRQVGFAAWIRPYVPDVWGEHIHAAAIQPGGKYDQGVLAASARRQVTAYYDGRDGLAGNRVDPHAGLGIEPITWEAYRRPKPVVSLSRLGRGKPASEDVKRVQRHLRRYVRPKLKVTGRWDRPTQLAWAAAVVKSGGKRRLELLRHLADLYGQVTAAP
jgi:hypothetical protein